MKKIIYILPLFLILGFAFPLLAANNVQVTSQTARQTNVSEVSSESSVQNRNQVMTQNEGEESGLQVETAEKEGTESGRGEGFLKRSPVALEHMSAVALKVQELLQLRTEGGIGDQVRQIARDQIQSQIQIQEQVDKVDSRGKLVKLLLGPDYKALKNINQLMEQNRQRIQLLQELQNQLVSQVDKINIEETIQALIQENTSLQEAISAEEKTKSLLGWFLKLFVK